MTLVLLLNINQNGEPHMEFYEMVKNAFSADSAFVISEEYAPMVHSELKQLGCKVYVIPHEVTNSIDKIVISRDMRSNHLQIVRSNELEDYLDEVITGLSEKPLVISDRYYFSLVVLEKQGKIDCLISSKEANCEENNVIVSNANMMSAFKQKAMVEQALIEKENHIHQLEKALADMNEWAESLRVHATNLDEELKQLKTVVLMDENDRSSYVKLQADSERYISLYKDLLQKYNALMEEKLTKDHKK